MLASFNGSNGAGPEAGLTLSGNTLYGTTYGGGANVYNYGTVFALTVPEPSAITLLLASAACLLGFAWRRRKTGNRALMVVALASVLTLAVGISQAQASNVFNMPAGQTSLHFVTVGDPGNVADTTVMLQDGTTGYGSVSYVYQIGKYDTTVGQYCQFLNAVAETDTYGLYNSSMATDLPTIGIAQNGSSGNYSYSLTGSYSQGVNCPIFDVTWGDAARFCNWLQNGQPTGPEGNGHDGHRCVYARWCGTNADLITIHRNPAATYFIPSENEWYKAAYYDPSTGTYWSYPTQSNTSPGNTLPDTGNNATYYGWNGSQTTYSDPTNFFDAGGGIFSVARA